MSEQENIKIAENFFTAINVHDLSRVEPYEADDYKSEAPGAQGVLNREQSRAYTQGFIDAFPDLHFDLIHKIAQGNYVVINWRASGTHKGDLHTPTGDAIPPTGINTMVPGSTTYEIKDGKITYAWIYWDMVTLLAQLGLMPGM